MDVVCDHCGMKFHKPKCKVKKRNFCSKRCMGISKRTQVEVPCTNCGKIIWKKPWHLKNNKGTYCSQSCRSTHKRGKDSANWKGGISVNYKLGRSQLTKWRFDVFKRDSFTCRRCGDSRGGNLNAHHILSFSTYTELREIVENGITLCSECHKDYHNQYGYKNFNSDSLWDWLYEDNNKE